ncbi:MAG: ATP-grasp domain-containing protein [Aminobacteriaceae bacterium]
MKLYEFQGKSLFREAGIPVPKGAVVTASDRSGLFAPSAVKAQVLSGGRGKAGGVLLASTMDEAKKAADSILSMELKGEPVKAVLVEEKMNIRAEYYLAVTFDGEAGTPLFMASASGGMDIESVAEHTPEKILKLPVDTLWGLTDYKIREMADFLGYENKKEFASFARKLWNLFREKEAVLVEINPLVVTDSGLVALDSKIEIDDDAKPRLKDLFEQNLSEQARITGKEADADHGTITYVPLDGNVGLISDGAGTGMLTLDLIKDFGGSAADFCEMGGLTSPEVMYSAMDQVFSDKKDIRSLLVVLIGGFNRMDEMAEGITSYLRDHSVSIPLVVRLCGTMEEEGKTIMKEAGLPVYDDLRTAVADAVRFAAGGE